MEIIGSGDRLKARWKALTRTLTGTSRTRQPDRVRTTRMGHETSRLTPGMKRALPANQKASQKKKAAEQRTARRTSTAARPIRCGTCGGFYGALKSTPGRPRAHKDVRTSRPCPGGGAQRHRRNA